MEHPQIQVGRVKIKNSEINKFIKNFAPPTARHLFDDKLNIKKDKSFSGFKSTNQEVRNYFVLRSSDVYQSKGLYRLRHIILTKSISSTGKITINDTANLILDIFNLIFKKFLSFFLYITRTRLFYILSKNQIKAIRYFSTIKKT